MARHKPASLTALVLLSWLAVSICAFRPIAAQNVPRMKPAAGRFLVANRRMRDPRFVKSVILLVNYGEKGAMGLIVNQPSGVKLAELLPEADRLEQRGDIVYIGGPVAQDGIMLLLRAETEPEGAEHIFADIYVSPNRDVLDRLVARELRQLPQLRRLLGLGAGAARPRVGAPGLACDRGGRRSGLLHGACLRLGQADQTDGHALRRRGRTAFHAAWRCRGAESLRILA